MIASTDCARSAQAVGAGLVPTKTSGLFIGSSVEEQTARRVARLRKALWGISQGIQTAMRAGAGFSPWMVTLTYRPGDEWQPLHLSACLQAFRKWLGPKLRVPYAWCAEMQKRGAVHYHIVIWLPQGMQCPKFDDAGLWPHGMSNRVLAVAPVAYLMKYASKGDNYGVQFPKGIRIYGAGALPPYGRALRTWATLPEWAKRVGGVGDLARSAVGLVVRATGQVLESPYVVRLLLSGVEVRAVRPVPPRFHDGPYSTWSPASAAL